MSLTKRKHLYRKDKKQIVYFDTLESIDLNETASFIYEHYVSGRTVQEIISNLIKEFNIPEDELGNDVQDTIEYFNSVGLFPETSIIRNGEEAI